MVRLKARTLKQATQRCKYFNSTMVRLKGVRVRHPQGQIHISIPLWYD